MADTTDLYLEEFDNKGNYLVDGKWLKMKKYEEIQFLDLFIPKN